MKSIVSLLQKKVSKHIIKTNPRKFTWIYYFKKHQNMASQFSTYTKEELLKKLKKQKLTSIIHGFIVLLMIVFAIFTTIEKGISFQTFLPLFFIPMEVIMLIELKKIKEELKNRN